LTELVLRVLYLREAVFIPLMVCMSAKKHGVPVNFLSAAMASNSPLSSTIFLDLTAYHGADLSLVTLQATQDTSSVSVTLCLSSALTYTLKYLLVVVLILVVYGLNCS
jgi:hypothetical protein